MILWSNVVVNGDMAVTITMTTSTSTDAIAIVFAKTTAVVAASAHKATYLTMVMFHQGFFILLLSIH